MSQHVLRGRLIVIHIRVAHTVLSSPLPMPFEAVATQPRSEARRQRRATAANIHRQLVQSYVLVRCLTLKMTTHEQSTPHTCQRKVVGELQAPLTLTRCATLSVAPTARRPRQTQSPLPRPRRGMCRTGAPLSLVYRPRVHPVHTK